jgi:APA family basic amino acid/polyamine antiporter
MTVQKLLGKWTSTSLVVGNMIGAGVFMMPAVLASYGGISLIGWLFSTVGALLLAALFSKLSKMLPGLQGGPYAYTREGMGDFSAFLVAWGYWISVWTTTAVLSVAFVSYLTVFVPVLKTNTPYSIGTALLVMWGLTWFNTRGVSKVGKLSLITTILKIVPIILIAIFGLFYIDVSNFSPFNTSGESNVMAIIAATSLTFFSFLGIESATIPAENVENPEKTVPFATKWGTGIAAFVYIISSISIMGMISPQELSASVAPFADAAVVLWGNGSQYLVATAATISVFGALNGWILIQGQMPEAISRDGLFPSFFARRNSKGMPALGIVVSSVLATVLILTNYSGGLLKVLEFMLLVSTVSVLIPYMFCSVSYVLLKRRVKLNEDNKLEYWFLAVSTFLFSTYALVGSGYDSVFWGLLFLLLGVPVYLIIKKSKSK